MTTLEEKLLASKAIMKKLGDDKAPKSIKNDNYNNIPLTEDMDDDNDENFMKNIPSMESIIEKKYDMPKANLSEDAIKKSRLPENIKKLMIEHPIPDPPMAGNSQFSEEFLNKIGKNMPQKAKKPITENKQNSGSVQNLKQIIEESLKKILPPMIDEKIKEVIGEAQDINEIFAIRVGTKLFTGKFTKVKNINK